MSPRTRSLLASLALAPALALSPAAPGAAAPSFPAAVPLPGSFAPEGIAGGPGTTFFAGSRSQEPGGGAVYRGDLRTGEGEVLVPPTGGASIGMQYDDATGLLWVAGGGTRTITAYDGRTGDQVAQYVADPVEGRGTFLNDVDVTADGVFVTDSLNARLLVVRDGALTELPLTGDWDQTAAGNNANGIRALPGGDLLVVDQGELLRVDPDSGFATRLPQTGGRDLTGGDGLELRGSTLYVVSAYTNENSVAVVELAQSATSYAVTDVLTQTAPATADLERPTTALFANGSLWVVNGKFGRPGAQDDEVVRLQP